MNSLKSVVAALASVLAVQAGAQSFTLPYVDNGAGFVVEVSAGGQTYHMMLGSCWSRSYASPPILQVGQIPLSSLGGDSIGTTQFLKRTIPGVDGAIGMDVLRWLSLGFDLYNHKVTIWTRPVPEKDALAWVAQTDKWSRYVTAQTTIPLELDSEDLPTVSMRAGGNDYTALLMTMTNATAMFGDHGAAAESTVSGACVAQAKVGGEALSWLRDSKTINGGRSPYPKLRIDAMLSVEDLLSPRVLVDFIGKKIYVDRMSDAGRATMLMDSLFRAPLVMTDTGIEIGGPTADFDESMSMFKGWKVSKIEDTPEATVRKMLMSPSPDSQKWLNAFLATIWKSYKIHTIGPTGTDGEISVTGVDSGG